MDHQTVRMTFKEKLRPTPAQERALDEVLWRCRDLYNAALEQRITAWQRAGCSALCTSVVGGARTGLTYQRILHTRGAFSSGLGVRAYAPLYIRRDLRLY